MTSSTPAGEPITALVLPLELKKGTELQGRYVVSEFIGTGGFGTVWRATDKDQNRDVAIKRLLKKYWRGSSADDRNSALEEGRHAARLKGHKNIVEIYDVFEESGDVFLVM